jgi:hypothetical protein
MFYGTETVKRSRFKKLCFLALTAAALCLSAVLAAPLTVKAAPGDTWSVKNANGWNRQAQRGGNPVGGGADGILNEDTPEYAQGYSKYYYQSASARNYCEPLDLRYPIRLQLTIDNGQIADKGYMRGGVNKPRGQTALNINSACHCEEREARRGNLYKTRNAPLRLGN